MLQPLDGNDFISVSRPLPCLEELAPNDRWINLYGTGPGWIYVDQPEDGIPKAEIAGLMIRAYDHGNVRYPPQCQPPKK